MTATTPKREGSRRRLGAVLFAIAWTVKLIVGLVDVTSRHVADRLGAIRSANYIGQLEYDLTIPLSFVLGNILLYLLARRVWPLIFGTVLLLEACCLALHTWYGTGGL